MIIYLASAFVMGISFLGAGIYIVKYSKMNKPLILLLICIVATFVIMEMTVWGDSFLENTSSKDIEPINIHTYHSIGYFADENKISEFYDYASNYGCDKYQITEPSTREFEWGYAVYIDCPDSSLDKIKQYAVENDLYFFQPLFDKVIPINTKP